MRVLFNKAKVGKLASLTMSGVVLSFALFAGSYSLNSFAMQSSEISEDSGDPVSHAEESKRGGFKSRAAGLLKKAREKGRGLLKKKSAPEEDDGFVLSSPSGFRKESGSGDRKSAAAVVGANPDCDRSRQSIGPETQAEMAKKIAEETPEIKTLRLKGILSYSLAQLQSNKCHQKHGIYRESASSETLNTVMEQDPATKGFPVVNGKKDNSEAITCNDYAVLVKKSLMNLVTKAAAETFLKKFEELGEVLDLVAAEQSRQRKVKELDQVFEKLLGPELFETYSRVLSEIMNNSQVNQMSPLAIAVVMVPALTDAAEKTSYVLRGDPRMNAAEKYFSEIKGRFATPLSSDVASSRSSSSTPKSPRVLAKQSVYPDEEYDLMISVDSYSGSEGGSPRSSRRSLSASSQSAKGSPRGSVARRDSVSAGSDQEESSSRSSESGSRRGSVSGSYSGSSERGSGRGSVSRSYSASSRTSSGTRSSEGSVRGRSNSYVSDSEVDDMAEDLNSPMQPRTNGRLAPSKALLAHFEKQKANQAVRRTSGDSSDSGESDSSEGSSKNQGGLKKAAQDRAAQDRAALKVALAEEIRGRSQAKLEGQNDPKSVKSEKKPIRPAPPKGVANQQGNAHAAVVSKAKAAATNDQIAREFENRARYGVQMEESELSKLKKKNKVTEVERNNGGLFSPSVVDKMGDEMGEGGRVVIFGRSFEKGKGGTSTLVLRKHTCDMVGYYEQDLRPYVRCKYADGQSSIVEPYYYQIIK